MTEKTGRQRQLIFRGDFLSPGDQWMFGMMLELGERVLDQVEHLPAEVLHGAPPGSYLTPARVVIHLIGNDLKMLSLITGGYDEPDFASEVQKTAAADLLTMETVGTDAVALLRKHLVFRRDLVAARCHEAGFLEGPLDHPACATRRDLLGHLIWHWSFHSGHIGAVTLEMGHEYIWTSARRP